MNYITHHYYGNNLLVWTICSTSASCHVNVSVWMCCCFFSSKKRPSMFLKCCLEWLLCMWLNSITSSHERLNKIHRSSNRRAPTSPFTAESTAITKQFSLEYWWKPDMMKIIIINNGLSNEIFTMAFSECAQAIGTVRWDYGACIYIYILLLDVYMLQICCYIVVNNVQ